ERAPQLAEHARGCVDSVDAEQWPECEQASARDGRALRSVRVDRKGGRQETGEPGTVWNVRIQPAERRDQAVSSAQARVCQTNPAEAGGEREIVRIRLARAGFGQAL